MALYYQEERAKWGLPMPCESRIPQRMTISCAGPEPTYKLHVQSALIDATGVGSEKAGQVVWKDFSSPSCQLPLCERVALQASNGQYVVAEGGGGGVVNANRSAIGPWETFVLVILP